MSMKITITATHHITTLEGVEGRVWHGVTEGGVKCYVFVHAIAVAEDDDTTEFEQELEEKLPPGFVVPLEQVL